MNIFQRIKCFFGHHKYFLIFIIDYENRKIGCRCCKKLWGMNDNVQLIVEWDNDLENMYRIAGKM